MLTCTGQSLGDVGYNLRGTTLQENVSYCSFLKYLVWLLQQENLSSPWLTCGCSGDSPVPWGSSDLLMSCYVCPHPINLVYRRPHSYGYTRFRVVQTMASFHVVPQALHLPHPSPGPWFVITLISNYALCWMSQASHLSTAAIYSSYQADGIISRDTIVSPVDCGLSFHYPTYFPFICFS